MRVSAVIAGVALLAAPIVAAGCSSHHTAVAAAQPAASATPHQAGRPDPHRFLVANAAAKTVGLTMLGALGSSNGGFNFDGYGRGELLASVPRGWRVVVHFENRGDRRTSAAVVTGARSATLAFPGASVPDPVQGVRPGGKAQFSFTATRPGSYRIASLVPGQSEARMYAVLVVTPKGRPSITARSGP
jgi:FtsP/CotA-like multicopper oxidase with cupredoxin domain